MLFSFQHLGNFLTNYINLMKPKWKRCNNVHHTFSKKCLKAFLNHQHNNE